MRFITLICSVLFTQPLLCGELELGHNALVVSEPYEAQPVHHNAQTATPAIGEPAGYIPSYLAELQLYAVETGAQLEANNRENDSGEGSSSGVQIQESPPQGTPRSTFSWLNWRGRKLEQQHSPAEQERKTQEKERKKREKIAGKTKKRLQKSGGMKEEWIPILYDMIREGTINQPEHIAEPTAMIQAYISDKTSSHELITICKRIPDYNEVLCAHDHDVDSTHPLAKAANSGDYEMIYYLLAQDIPSELDFLGYTALLNEHVSKELELTSELKLALRALVNREAEKSIVDLPSNGEQSPRVHRSTQTAVSPQEMQPPRKKVAQINALTIEHPLYEACKQGETETIFRLLVEEVAPGIDIPACCLALIDYIMTNGTSIEEEQGTLLREALKALQKRSETPTY